MIPEKLSGKDFENLILFRAHRLEEQGILTMGRYGTQVVMMNDDHGIPRWQPIPSLPDFEGIVSGTGQQIIIEAKVCSQASYPIHQAGKAHPKQFSHMLKRAEFGARCYLLLHFNGREMKTKSDPSTTYAIKVHPDLPLWREHAAAERLSIGRSEADLFGTPLEWNLYSDRASKFTPNIASLIQ